MRLAIDFDGVLHDHKNPIPGRRMGAPIEGAVRAMQQLKANGHTLIVHSVWGGNPKTIQDWCTYYGLPYDEVTNIKPNADVYLDDRAIRFTSWLEAMSAISEVR